MGKVSSFSWGRKHMMGTVWLGLVLAQCGQSWAQTSKISEKNSVSIKYGILGEISTNQNQENKAISLPIIG